MSRLAPGLIELNKGLDLNTAKIAAPEGTLLDSLNYEQVDFQGQKRIDGYARYDGSKGSYIDDFLRIEGSSGTPGDIVHLSSSGELGAEGKLFGIVVGSSDGSMDVAVIDETLIPKLSAAHAWGTKAAGLSPDEHYELILLYNQVLRERTTELPGPVAGLHWFRDRLYAVADVLAIVVGAPVEDCSRTHFSDGYNDESHLENPPEWVAGYGHVVISNYPCNYDWPEDQWQIIAEVQEYDGEIYLYKDQENGYPPYAHYDGPTHIERAFMFPWTDGCEEVEHCIDVSLQLRWPQ